MAEQRLKHSGFGIASCVVGIIMLLLQLAVFVAVATGVKDNQGTIYAFSIPIFTYLIGVPAGLILALVGFAQRQRKRLFATLGVCPTLAGPLVFASNMYSRMPPQRGIKAYWFANIDGAGSFEPQQVIITSPHEDYRPHPADVDGDKDFDLLSSRGDKISWHENTDAAGAFGQPREIRTNFINLYTVSTTDVDRDGDLDILCVVGFTSA